MDRKGQMTLEIVIMLLLVINIYAYISRPLSDVSMAATESIGVSAMAVKAVDTIANKVNLVGVGGAGATDKIKINTFGDFNSISCPPTATGGIIRITYDTYNSSLVGDTDAFGVLAATGDKVTFRYSKTVDFPVACNDIGSISNSEGQKCLKFSNNDNQVSITSILC